MRGIPFRIKQMFSMAGIARVANYSIMFLFALITSLVAVGARGYCRTGAGWDGWDGRSDSMLTRRRLAIAHGNVTVRTRFLSRCDTILPHIWRRDVARFPQAAARPSR